MKNKLPKAIKQAAEHAVKASKVVLFIILNKLKVLKSTSH